MKLELVKEAVCKIAKKAQNEGMCKHKSGNFSQLLREEGLLVVTPSGVDRDDLSPRDMIVMDLNYNVVESLAGLKPSSEVLVHIEIYKARKDIDAIVHTHSKYATSFAVAEKEIPSIVAEVNALNLKQGIVPVAKYKRPGTMELAKEVAQTSEQADVLLMQNHGTIALGKDIKDAYLKASYLEELAEIYYHSLVITAGNEPFIIPNEDAENWSYPEIIKFK